MILNVISWVTRKFIETADLQDLFMSQEVQPGQCRAAAKRRASLLGSCVHHRVRGICASLCIPVGAWDRLVRGMACISLSLWLCECERWITTTVMQPSIWSLGEPGKPLHCKFIHSLALSHARTCIRVWNESGSSMVFVRPALLEAANAYCACFTLFPGHVASALVDRRSVTFCDKYALIWILLLCYALPPWLWCTLLHCLPQLVDMLAICSAIAETYWKSRISRRTILPSDISPVSIWRKGFDTARKTAECAMAAPSYNHGEHAEGRFRVLCK